MIRKVGRVMLWIATFYLKRTFYLKKENSQQIKKTTTYISLKKYIQFLLLRTSHRIPLTFRILANHQLNHSKQIQTNIQTHTYISISSNHPIIQLVYKKTILYIYIFISSLFFIQKKNNNTYQLTNQLQCCLLLT